MNIKHNVCFTTFRPKYKMLPSYDSFPIYSGQNKQSSKTLLKLNSLD